MSSEPTDESVQRSEIAFRIWCTEGEQDDGITAELANIPRRTIAYYRKRDDWTHRWSSAIGPEADAATLQGRNMLRLATPGVAKRLMAIVMRQTAWTDTSGKPRLDQDGNPIMKYVSSDHDAVQASKLILLYNLGERADVSIRGDDAITAHFSPLQRNQEAPETLADMREAASRMIEATVANVNTRTTTRSNRKARI